MRPPRLFKVQAEAEGPETVGETGRYIIRFARGQFQEGVHMLEGAGLRVASMEEGVLRGEEAGDAEVLLIPNLASGLLSGEEDQYELVNSLSRSNRPDSPIVSIEPERFFAIKTFESRSEPELEDLEPTEAIAPSVYWWLGSTGVAQSAFSGQGISVAILDTGLDFNHPDWRGRVLPANRASFVFGVPTADDGHGHGTHTAGLACGVLNPIGPSQRYGVAHQAEVLIGKVIDDAGIGTTGEVLKGIGWALSKNAEVVLLALEIAVSLGSPFNSDFERVGRLALQQGSLLIAAVGNDSLRPTDIQPVSEPANCPSIFGVGAVTRAGSLWDRSNGERPFQGAGTVDLVAPGVGILSSHLPPNGYLVLDGTSMAAAITAGIAALHAETDPTARGARLFQILRQTAHSIGLPPEDSGSGFIQAP